MKKKSKKSKSIKNVRRANKGITLIALVITIIVLLILAGVSIAMLTGENGILTQANTAKKQTDEANAKEAVQMEIAGSFDENGYNKDIAIENLKNNLGITATDNGDGTLTVEYEGYTFTVDVNGRLKDGGTPATASAVNALIGQVVAYEDGSGEVDSWRVYYASDTEMFLISTNTVASITAFGSGSGIPLRKTGASANYSGAADVFSAKTESGTGYSYSNVKYGETYNKFWSDTSTTDANPRSKATAYLCDPANWIKYIGSNAPSGTYAVGGPTEELFIKSWNASIPQTGVKEFLLESANVTKDGYDYNKPDQLVNDHLILETILPATENGTDGLYNNEKSYWLASPSRFNTGSVCYVNRFGYVFTNDYSSTKLGVRPLVSIPMSKVQIEDGIVKIGN